MSQHEVVEIEIIKCPIGEVCHKSAYHIDYILHIRDRLIPFTQYELDLLFKALKSQYGKSDNMVEDD